MFEPCSGENNSRRRMNVVNMRHCQGLHRYPSEHFFFKDCHVSPACPSDSSTVMMKLSVEYWWNDFDRRKLRYSGTELSQCHFFHYYIYRD